MKKQYNHNDINPFIGNEGNVMIGRNGELTMGFEMYFPPIFTVAEEVNDAFVEKFTQGIKILPDFCRIHRQDFFGEKFLDIKKLMTGKEKENFFEKEYIRTFSARPVFYQRSYIYFTLIPKAYHNISVGMSNAIKSKGYLKNKTSMAEFVGQVEQFISFLSSVINQDEEGQPPRIRFRLLSPSDYLKNVSSSNDDGVLAKHLFLSDPIYSDISYDKTTQVLRVGEKIVDIFSVSDLDKMPGEVSSSIGYDVYNELPASWGTYLGPMIRFPHIVNTFIIKGSQEGEKSSLDRKKNLLRSFATVSRSNSLGEEQIEGFLNYVEEEKASIIDFHLNVIVWDRDERALAVKRQSISTMLTTLGCENPKAEQYNKLNLFIASLAGNSINIFDEYRAKTLDVVGAIMLNYAGLQETNLQEKGFRVLDRLSKSPVKIDLDEPYEKYGFNKNMFVLGGSGAGKSFAMNHYLNGELESGADVLIIDIGKSYEGLCSAYNGKWFEFKEDAPLSFNPFVLSEYDWNATEKTLNDEKAQALAGIIKVLWKGSDADVTFSQTETTLLLNLLNDYYRFDIEKRCFNTFYEYVSSYEFESSINFHKGDFLHNLKICYHGGNYSQLLNAETTASLLDEKLIIFELDNIKKNKLLLPIVTTVVMDTFVSKMRNKGGKKIIVFEEAWAALSNDEMSSLIQWLAKTARKFNSKLIVVTQELDDILKSKIGQSLISNCTEKFLLDLSNFKKSFEKIKEILGLTNFQEKQIFSINKGKEPGDKSRDFYIGFQYGKSTVAQVSVSRAEALLYTSSQEEKNGIRYVAKLLDISYSEAIKYIMTNMIQGIDEERKRVGCDFFLATQTIMSNPKHSII